MERTTQRAYAKLNLTLGVLYQRTDGYHALDSIMQTISLHDTVTVERARDIVVTSTGMTLPYDNTLRSYDDASYSSQTKPYAFISTYNDLSAGGSVLRAHRPSLAC